MKIQIATFSLLVFFVLSFFQFILCDEDNVAYAAEVQPPSDQSGQAQAAQFYPYSGYYPYYGYYPNYYGYYNPSWYGRHWRWYR